WENVELSLVAGAPQSFIQQLSQPYYSRRPVVPLPESVQLEPQTHAATLIPGNGTITGTVTDPSGADVAGATVRVYDANNNLAGTATTDGEGNYEVTGLPEGNYRVEVAQQGFRSYVEYSVAVTGGEEVSKDVALQLGAASEVVEIQAAAASPGLALNTLPSISKKVSSFVRLQPGMSPEGRGMSVDAATLNATRAAQQAAA